MLLRCGFVPGSEEEVSVLVASQVLMGADKGRVAGERRPRLAYTSEAHERLGRQPWENLKACNLAGELWTCSWLHVLIFVPLWDIILPYKSLV